MTQDQLLIGIILAIAGNALVQLFRLMKNPKEINGELSQKLDDVKEDHELLARRFERHDEVVKNLIQALDRLTQRIDRLEPHLAKPNGPRGPRGG
jgi:hypothetical protein